MTQEMIDTVISCWKALVESKSKVISETSDWKITAYKVGSNVTRIDIVEKQ